MIIQPYGAFVNRFLKKHSSCTEKRQGAEGKVVISAEPRVMICADAQGYGAPTVQ